MPGINPTLPQAVPFLYPGFVDQDDDETNLIGGGTGVVVGVAYGYRPGDPFSGMIDHPGHPLHLYVVTAGHNLQGAELDMITVRLWSPRPDKPPETREFLHTKAADWTTHPHGADLAALPIGTTRWRPYQRCIELRGMVVKPGPQSHNIGLGNDVFFLSRFIHKKPEIQIVKPILRFGGVPRFPWRYPPITAHRQCIW